MAETVGMNIEAIFARRRAAAVMLCLEYAGRILAEFRQRQADQGGFLSGATQFWTNRTGVAAATVFSDAIIEDDEIGFFIAHMIEYGVYLELANDRAYEALRPLVEEFYPEFKKDLAEIYGVAA
jgi:hypothetical protein